VVSFLSGFPFKTLHTFLSFPMSAACSARLILLDLIYLIIFGDLYKLWSFSLCNFLHFLWSKFSPQNSVLKHPLSIYSLPLKWKTKFQTCTKQLAELLFCVF
jgi:hypothetical protein